MSNPAIQLSPDVSRQLHDLCKSPLSALYRNARIIFLTADGVPANSIAHALGVSVRSVRNTIRVFKASGLDGLTTHGAAGRPPGLTSEQREAIIDLLRRHPSEFGIEKSSWTAADFAMVAEREGVVGKISPATVRRVVQDADLDWNAAKRPCHGKATVSNTVVADDEVADIAVEESMSLQELWSSVFVKSKAEQERLVSIYSTLVRRYGSRDGGNHLHLELLATHLLGALKHQESGDRESVDKALTIVRSYLEELERESALRKKRAGPPPGTTPAEVASELLKRWQREQCEERNR